VRAYQKQLINMLNILERLQDLHCAVEMHQHDYHLL